MKKERISVILISLIILACGVNACGGEDGTSDLPIGSIVGSWQNVSDPDEKWVFFENGSYKNFEAEELCEEGNYTVSQNKLDIYYYEIDYCQDMEQMSGTFTIEEDKLIFTFKYIDMEDSEDLTTIVLKRV